MPSSHFLLFLFFKALKYDEDDAEDKQLTAERHKNEGNKHFQYKKYRWATDCYTEGKDNRVLYLIFP